LRGQSGHRLFCFSLSSSPLSRMSSAEDDVMAHEDHHDVNFDRGESGGSATYPMQCSALRKGGHVVLKDRPCRVVEMSTSKTGKHGHAKVHLVGIDIFTGRKYEDMCPSTHNMMVPNIQRSELQLLDITDDGFTSLLLPDGSTKDNVKLPAEEDVAGAIRQMFDDGKDVMVTVLATMGLEAIVGFKEGTSK
jgi:translation initiation factor 5A